MALWDMELDKRAYLEPSMAYLAARETALGWRFDVAVESFGIRMMQCLLLNTTSTAFFDIPLCGTEFLTARKALGVRRLAFELEILFLWENWQFLR
jgi:hypothetical protein